MLQVLGENLITLLAYHDEQAKIIRGVVDVNLFGGPLRLIAQRVYEYIDLYNKAPGDHLADLLADKLEVEGAEGGLFRCEAVLFLVSEAWLASRWCFKEFNLALKL